jgi:hypothetical protein
VAESCRPIVHWFWRAGSASATSSLLSASGTGRRNLGSRSLDRRSGSADPRGPRVLVVGEAPPAARSPHTQPPSWEDLGLRSLAPRPGGSASAVRVPAGAWRRGAARLPYPLLRGGIATAEAGRSGGGGSDRPRDRCRAAPSVPVLAPGEGTDGRLWVDHHLSSPADGCTLDGGDSASFRGQGLTRLGVFAIRQGARCTAPSRPYSEASPGSVEHASPRRSSAG